MKHWLLAMAGVLTAACTTTAEGQPVPAVSLEPKGDAVRLMVDGEPFLMLAGETGNSTASDLGELASHWDTFAALNMNTVLAPVYWELLEPQEGQFDFTLVDGMVAQARQRDMKIVILWFGTWKNSMSTYVPGWVKADPERFSRMRTEVGAAQDILSPYDEETLAADAAAFAALLQRLAEIDPGADTVIMVQVENEVGMIPAARDHSPLAEAAWAAPVPSGLMQALATRPESFDLYVLDLWAAQGSPASGSWAEVFGTSPQAEEVFTAWGLARFCDAVAAAGKARHPLPMYVNAALDRDGVAPGAYPSGGPLDHLLGVWQAGAPNLDLLAPDIYFENYVERIAPYKVPSNAVFIPEANRAGRAQAPADALWSFGELDAIGFSPFSIENIGEDNIGPLAETYAAIASIAPLIADAQGTDRMWGLRPEIAYDGTLTTDRVQSPFGRFAGTVSFIDPWTPRTAQMPEAHGALVIQTGEDEFLVVGKGVTLTFTAEDGSVGIDWAQEGRYEDGEWVGGMWLNGDQTHQGRHIRLPPGPVSMQRFRLYTYD